MREIPKQIRRSAYGFVSCLHADEVDAFSIQEVCVMKWLGGIAVAGLLVTGCSAPSAETAGTALADDTEKRAEAPAPVVPVVREVTLPAGTTLRLKLATAVGSDTSTVEDQVRATIRQAVVIEGQTVLPAGTEVIGTVTAVERSGRVKGRARVAYRFDTLRHDDESYRIRTALLAHQAEATKRQDATKIAAGAGAGAVLGAVLGGGGGAAKGAAIGGAAGTGVVLATRGKEVRLGPGANVTTKLEAPLTVRVSP
jgi:hypothetical protein